MTDKKSVAADEPVACADRLSAALWDEFCNILQGAEYNDSTHVYLSKQQLAGCVERVLEAISDRPQQAASGAVPTVYYGGSKEPEPVSFESVPTVVPAGERETLNPAHTDNAPIGFTDHEKSAWSVGFEEGRAAHHRQPAGVALTDAARDVLAERKRQVSVEGWTPAHDDEHSPGALSQAAACYIEWNGWESELQLEDSIPINWPWAAEWWKPSDDRRNLVKAGALILAEIERLDRATNDAGAN